MKYQILLLFPLVCIGLNNCPTAPIRSVIQRAAETTTDAVTQMQMIRRILEDIYGGTWGVLVVRNPSLISKDRPEREELFSMLEKIENRQSFLLLTISYSVTVLLQCIDRTEIVQNLLFDLLKYTVGGSVAAHEKVHWTFPDHNNSDGTPAFCLTVVNKWQYNVFKTGQIDSPQRVTIDNMIQRFTSGTLPKVAKLKNGRSRMKNPSDQKIEGKMKEEPKRYSIAELDRILVGVLEDGPKTRHNRSPKLVVST